MVTDLRIYNKILSLILKEQETILGSLAWQIAEKSQGIQIANRETFTVNIMGDPKSVIDNFVFRCERVFGSFARDACKQTVAHILAEMPSDDIPNRLR